MLENSLSPRFIGWHGNKSNPLRNRSIPKKIWTYWNSTTIPRSVRACIESWKDHHPDYLIVQLNPENISNYADRIPKNFSEDTPQRQADWVRLAVLKEHGGIWMDATTITFRRLDFLHQIQQTHGSELVAFFNKQHTSNPLYPVIENWFIAAPPESCFIKDWHDEFGKSIRDGAHQYIESLSSEFKLSDLSQNLKKPAYFSMHIAAQVIMNRDNNYSLSLIPADNDAFKIARQLSWNLDQIAEALCDRDDFNAECNLFKITGKVWEPIHHKLVNQEYLPSSIMGKLYSCTAS